MNRAGSKPSTFARIVDILGWTLNGLAVFGLVYTVATGVSLWQ